MDIDRIMSTPYIILPIQPLPNASRCYISLWEPAMDLESSSLCICAAPPLSWNIASCPETSLPSWPIQKSTVLSSRHIFTTFYCSPLWFHGIWFSRQSFHSFVFAASGVSCPRATSHKVFLVDRLTDSALTETRYPPLSKQITQTKSGYESSAATRGGCWNAWSANMIGCLCLSQQWAPTTGLGKKGP